MSRGLPIISQGKKVCIICEGYEEYEYISKLKELKVWNSEYYSSLGRYKTNFT